MSDESRTESTIGANHPVRRTEGFFGRRKGQAISRSQQLLLDEVLPKHRVDLQKPVPRQLVSNVRLEIGFGGGEHLVDAALKHPDQMFLGVEPFVNSLAKAVRLIDDRKLRNVLLFDDDATLLLDWLPAGSVTHIDLLYPDPWPKRRHWKRRFVNQANLDRFAKVLRPGGRFRFASDIDSYINWTLNHVELHAAFQWSADSADDWNKPWVGWPSTRYEAKAIREGRTPCYLEFLRKDAS